jgi:hypothetical protein
LKKNRLRGPNGNGVQLGSILFVCVLAANSGICERTIRHIVFTPGLRRELGLYDGSTRWRNRSPETGPFQADRVLKGKKRNLRLGPRDRLEGSVPAVSMYMELVPLFDNASRMPSVLQGIHCHTWIAFLVITFQLLTRQNIEDV